jgi:hypothetical protein
MLEKNSSVQENPFMLLQLLKVEDTLLKAEDTLLKVKDTLISRVWRIRSTRFLYCTFLIVTAVFVSHGEHLSKVVILLNLCKHAVKLCYQIISIIYIYIYIYIYICVCVCVCIITLKNKKKEYVGNLAVNETIFKCTLKKWDMRFDCRLLIRLKEWTIAALLWTRWWMFSFHRSENFFIHLLLLVLHEGFCFLEVFNFGV